jgi:uncharacterized protein
MIFMKKLLTILLALLSMAVAAQNIPPRPNPPKLVNDLADMLTPEQEAALERKLDAYDDSTSTQIAIVTVGTLNGYAPVDYAVKLGREWGVGGKDYNNGVIILVSTGADGSRREAFIATGYGMEGVLPDIICKQITDNELVPYLKSGNAYRGFEETTDAIIKAAAGEYKAPEGYRANKNGIKSIVKIAIIILLIIIFVAVSSGGSGGGGMMSRRGYRNLNGPIWWFPSGGGSGGGWPGGGGGSSGGFGGFGGGSFGGGGGGSSW